MILGIEIVFLIAGVYALFTAKLPSWIVGKGYKAEGTPIRLLGMFMAALLPGVFCAGMALGLVSAVMEFDPTVPAVLLEIGSVIIAAIIVSVLIRRLRQPDAPPAQPPSPQIDPN